MHESRPGGSDGYGRERREKKDGITRREFLDGVAIGAAGLAVAATAPHLTGAEASLVARGQASLPPGYYPPSFTGITGLTDSIVGNIMKIDGRPNPEDVHSTHHGPGIHPGQVHETGEVYDCVIVGSGISGIASAKWYRDRFGDDSRILLIDQKFDFGGHDQRDEFHIPNAANGGADTELLYYGGSIDLDHIPAWNRPAGSPSQGRDIPGSYGQPALDMLDYLGITPEHFPNGSGPGIPSSYGLRSMLLFAREDWGADYVVPNKTSAQSWPDFLSTTPFSAQAQADIARWMTDTTTDYIVQHGGPKTNADKKALLAQISYKTYLTKYVGITEEATRWIQRRSHGYYGTGIQLVPAADLWLLGGGVDYPGFDGLNISGDFPGVGRSAQMYGMQDRDLTVNFPDGNASVARLLVSKLIPNAFADVDGARPNQETIVEAVCDYTQLDRPSNPVRIRLQSAVSRVRPADQSGGLAEVEYIDGNGGWRVRGTHVVMACYNRVTARLVEGLPQQQIENLDYARKTPLIYARAGLRNWQAFADAKISGVSPIGISPFWDSIRLVAGQVFGSTYGPTPNQPSAPAILQFNVTPTGRSPLSASSQLQSYEQGREQLLQMSFDDLESALIDMLDRTVNQSGGDFDPERDIESIMINRHNYGYAYELSSLFDPSLYGPDSEQPQVKGRVPFRNVAIANSDSGAFAYQHSAIDEGYRAVHDLPALGSRQQSRRRPAGA
ncbi:MAG: hypothetical protein LBJ87_07270 [bacterium]|jgi:spermidine dehydrogenase|nr:hypothetical protein [bacterium]